MNVSNSDLTQKGLNVATTEDFYAEMRERQAAAKPHLTERVMVCRFCGADVPLSSWGRPNQNAGIRLVDSYERSDGMMVENYALLCCDRSAPFDRFHVNPNYGIWIRRSVPDGKDTQ